MHGEDGLGEARPPLEASDSVFGEESAADFIYRACSEASGEITLVTLGPLTNLAQVRIFHETLVQPQMMFCVELNSTAYTFYENAFVLMATF